MLSCDLKPAACGLLDASHISDHALTYAVLDLPKPSRSHQYLQRRNLKAIPVDEFNTALQGTDWSPLYNAPTTDDKANILHALLTSHFDRFAPIEQIRVTKPPSPWMTANIQRFIKMRNRALAKFKRSHRALHWSNYKTLRNLCTCAIRAEKRAFFLHLSNSTPSSRQFWHYISLSGLHSPRRRPSSFTSLNDPNLINNHFLDTLPPTSVPPELVAKFLSSSSANTFSFSPFSLNDLYLALRNIKLTSAGPNDISGTMVLYCIPHCLDPILHIFNSSLSSGTVPSIWKHAIVHPIPKSPASSKAQDLSSLRPISLIPFLSKLFERLCCRQLQHFVEQCGVLPNHQSGFRRGFSTTTSMLHISDTILRALDSSRLAVITSLDFSKAFDTLDHDLLIAKLHHIGLSPLALNWFRSYLTARSQQVVVVNACGSLYSSSRCTLRGVPQGSVFGPLLFLIYVADLLHVPKFSVAHMYADDLQLITTVSAAYVDTSTAELEQELGDILIWTKSHGLSLNPSKTSLIIVGTPTRLAKLPPFSLSFDSATIVPSSSFKSLGLRFDPLLHFENHISDLCCAAYTRLRILYPSRYLLTIHQKLLLSQSLIISLFDYCDVVYGPRLSVSLASRVQLVQNSCLRFSYCARKFDHISPLLKKSGWLPMKQRWILHLCCIIYKILRDCSPPYLFNLLPTNASFHTAHSTRSQDLLSIPYHRTNSLRASFSYVGPHYYNSLPSEIRALPTLSSFRCSCKSFLLLHPL